jgi:solute:Na+ symporter, SSS family
MNRSVPAIALIVLLLSSAHGQIADLLTWRELPTIPPAPGQTQQPGLAGSFVGVHQDVLIIAGGSNFPEGMPWRGGKKEFYDNIYVLQKESEGQYRWSALESPRLPRPIAYGASVSTAEGIICIGGCDAEQCYADVILLQWDAAAGTVRIESLPSLRVNLAFMTAAKAGDRIFVAGGRESAKSIIATKNFLELDWSKRSSRAEFGWRQVESWPGPERILAVSAGQSDGETPCFYLFSGKNFQPGRPAEVLTDAYRYNPILRQWKPLGPVGPPSEPPLSLAAGTAVPFGEYHIMVIGGDRGEPFLTLQGLERATDGIRRLAEPMPAGSEKDALLEQIQSLEKQRADLLEHHPGFDNTVWFYHTLTDTWAKTTPLPAALPPVTTTVVNWDGGVVVAGGEIKPGIRTAAVWEGRPKELAQGRFGVVNWIVLIGYLLSLVWMGMYFSKREKTTGDFFLAGQRIPWWAAGISIYGTQLSAITYIAIPATSFRLDWLMFMGNFTILMAAPIVAYFFLPFYRRLGLTSAYEYLEKRFSVAVRLYCSLVYIIMQLGRMAVVMLLPAMALSTVTGIDTYASIVIMGVLCTFYTVMGGMEAVIWTDVLQVIVLMGGAIVSIAFAVLNLDGGLGEIFRVGLDAGKFRMVYWSWDHTALAIWVVLFGGLLTTLIPYTTDQTVVQRYLTTRDEAGARQALWTNGFLTIPGSILFFLIGTALFAFYKRHPDLLNPTLANDAIFPLFIQQKLPAGVGGLVISGVFAAAMSTLSGCQNSTATAMITDFYRRFHHAAADSHCLHLARWLTVLLGVVVTAAAMIMAFYGDRIQSLWFFFVTMLGLIGGGLGGIFTLAIFTRRATGVGAITGAVAAAAVQIYVSLYTSVHFYLYAAIGIGICVAVGYAVSLLFPGGRKPLSGLTYYTLNERADAHSGEPPHL